MRKKYIKHNKAHFPSIFKINFYIFLISIYSFVPVSVFSRSIELIKKYELGSEKDKNYLFIRISDIKIGLRGDIFVLDSGNNCLKKYSKEYKFITEVGKKGQGPGEMSGPLGFTLDKDDNIYLNDIGNRRINIYDSNLIFVKTIPLKEDKTYKGLFFDDNNHLIFLCSPRHIKEKYFYVYTSEGDLLYSFFPVFRPDAPKLTSTEHFLSTPQSVLYYLPEAAINPERNIIAFTYKIPENPYRIYFINLKGDVIKIFEKRLKNYNPREQIDSSLKKAKFPRDEYLSISGLHFTKEGFLIVQKKIDAYQKGKFLFIKHLSDIFSASGKILKEDLVTEPILAVDGENNIYAVREDETGEIKIVIYSLQIRDN